MKDPVCGMEVDPERSKWAVEQGGKTYYFCSESCQKAFLEEPERYLGHRHGGASHGVGCCGLGMGRGWLNYLCLIIHFLLILILLLGWWL